MKSKKDTYFESAEHKELQCPPVDASLVNFLAKQFPDRCPVPTMSDREVWMATGATALLPPSGVFDAPRFPWSKPLDNHRGQFSGLPKVIARLCLGWPSYPTS